MRDTGFVFATFQVAYLCLLSGLKASAAASFGGCLGSVLVLLFKQVSNMRDTGFVFATFQVAYLCLLSGLKASAAASFGGCHA